ncbi:uncharacterized protein [Branchiostoma lanceolatum]|uniref:uncharacterized protein n=1 Tax=Branchiostoma lanceolatum TaxID=7740 RepID=UPI0034543D1A
MPIGNICQRICPLTSFDKTGFIRVLRRSLQTDENSHRGYAPFLTMAPNIYIVLCVFLFIHIFVPISEAKPVYIWHRDGELSHAKHAEHGKKGGIDMGLLNSMLNLKPTIEPVDLPEAVAVTAQQNFRDKLGKRKNKKGNEVDMGLLNSFLNLEPTIEPIDLPEAVKVTAAPDFREVKEKGKGNDVRRCEEKKALNRLIDGLLKSVKKALDE